jgi:hypothetical protein
MMKVAAVKQDYNLYCSYCQGAWKREEALCT